MQFKFELELGIIMPHFEKKGAYCFAKSVGPSVHHYVRLSVDQMVFDHYL